MKDDDRVIAVCAPVGYFGDDVHGFCACGAGIVWRPHVPAEHLRVCCACAAKMMASDPDVQVGITEETLRELVLYNTRTTGRH